MAAQRAAILAGPLTKPPRAPACTNSTHSRYPVRDAAEAPEQRAFNRVPRPNRHCTAGASHLVSQNTRRRSLGRRHLHRVGRTRGRTESARSSSTRASNASWTARYFGTKMTHGNDVSRPTRHELVRVTAHQRRNRVLRPVGSAGPPQVLCMRVTERLGWPAAVQHPALCPVIPDPR
jgi:hypothetical protein